MNKRKILFCSSAGGHYTELLQLKSLIKEYNGVIVTEKTAISQNSDFHTEFLPYGSRNEGWKYYPKFFYVFVLSVLYFMKHNPAAIISTGVHSTLPICMVAKLFQRKVIYIETIAVVESPTLTGKIMYKIADEFYVQWEELLEVYPKAIYGGVLF